MNLNKIKKFIFSGFRRSKYQEIAPDEIFLDSSNIPDFDTDQFEGRLEKPISKKTLFYLGTFFILIAILFVSRAWNLQLINGATYEKRSENNHLRNDVIIASRSIITDRKGEKLAWNEIAPDQNDFPQRVYTDTPGLSNLLGYVKYPAKDTSGIYYRPSYLSADGVEKFFNQSIAGKNGLKITETDAVGHVQSQSVVEPPENGKNFILAIDKNVQSALYKTINQTAETSGFRGGAGVIMNIQTGEVLALVTYPNYDSNVMTGGAATSVKNYLADPRNLFLDRAISGLYTPGSIVKPFLALGALNENIISPDKQILSTGALSIPNPYHPGEKTVFKDWRVNGWTDMREALAVSSDVYFYEVGGGYQDQRGLGISNIEKYAELFGFGSELTGTFFAGPAGTVPSPQWKAKNFNGESWLLGDTYHTAIGQYGFQVTPIQAVRAVAAIANNGSLITPTIVSGQSGGPSTHIAINNPSDFQIIREGMRQAVTSGTVTALSTPGLTVAAKTGTAELGSEKQYVNSWVEGFFPYENPKYAFALVLEKGPAHYASGAPATMRTVLDWMVANTPEYVN